MTVRAVLVLYPAWGLAVLLGASALRVGSRKDRGLVALCFLVALWITALILHEHPLTSALAERVIPSGMLLAGGFVHAGQDILGSRSRRALLLGYGFGAVVALLGAMAPRLIYSEGLAAPGPIFWPLAALSFVGTVWVVGWMLRATWRAQHEQRRRMLAVTLGNLLGCAAGGGAVVAHFAGLIDDITVTAPLLLAASMVIGWAVLVGEHGRTRRLLAHALFTSVLTAVFATAGLTLFIVLLPQLLPAPTLSWMLLVIFLATLPLDAARALLVDRLARLFLRKPSGVRDLADELEESETRAEHAERLAAIGAITSAVAHEIRNPLGVIAAQAKLLERQGASPESVAALRAQVDRARVFLDDLLRYGKPRPLDVGQVVLRQVVDAAAAASGFEVRLDVPDLTLSADRAAVHDILVVLLGNAGIAGGKAVVQARRDGDSIELSVEDDGPGVPPEIEDRLFEPFVTGRGRDHKHPGTGLGLAIARRWAERHGGTLVHQRPPGGGARFVLRLPSRGL